jgi:hypothetical protein
MADDMNASTAFWNKITSTLAIHPVDNVEKSQRQAKLIQFQKLGANVSLASIRETLSLAFDEAAEIQGERMAGDDLDLVGDERDSRLQLAAFDEALSKKDEQFKDTYEPDLTVSDGLTWSHEASSLAKLLESDLRLEKQRRPELRTRPFLQQYFKTLRLVELGITRVDPGMRNLTNLKSLSLSSNQITVLSVPCLPPNLEVLNMYNCGLREIKTTFRDRHRQIQTVTLPSLLHFGVGCNGLDERGLASISNAFPSLTSLDICNNGLSQRKEVMDILSNELPEIKSLVLIGNSLTMELGYRCRTLCELTNLSQLDDQPHDEDDIRAAREKVKKMGLDQDENNIGTTNGDASTKVGDSEKSEEGSLDNAESGNLSNMQGVGYTPGTVTLRARITTLSQLPGPLVEVVPPSEESVKEAEDRGEELPQPTFIVKHGIIGEESDTEKMMSDAEMVDLRYFIRIKPPGSMGISQTTNAKVWKYPNITFNEDITLSIPMTSDLAFDCKFVGMKYEIYASLPGVKEDKLAEEEGKEKEGGKEEEGKRELTEEEQTAKDEADEAARLEAVKPPPRVESLVATGTLDISMCLDYMSDGQCENKGVKVVLVPPNPLLADPLSLNQMLKMVENSNSGLDGENDGEKDDETAPKLAMPSMICSFTLNPQSAPEPMEPEEDAGMQSKPGSKKGKKKKK